MDLTPRTGPDDTATVHRRKRTPAVWVLLGVVVLAAGFVVFQFLSEAAVYYRNADEAVAQKESLGTSRFRVQGDVEDDVVAVGDAVEFSISFNGVRVPVRHRGDPPELFQPGIPVVLEGHWSERGDVYESDTMQVKHSAEYRESNPDRVPAVGP